MTTRNNVPAPAAALAPPPVAAALAALDVAIAAERKARTAEAAAAAEVKAAPAADLAAARNAATAGKPQPAPTSEKRRVALDAARVAGALAAEQATAAARDAEQAARDHRTEWVTALGDALDNATAAAVDALDTARATAARQAVLASAYGALRVAPLSRKALPERAPNVDVEGLDELAASLDGITRAAIDARVDELGIEPAPRPDLSGFAVPDPWRNGQLVDVDQAVGA